MSLHTIALKQLKSFLYKYDRKHLSQTGWTCS